MEKQFNHRHETVPHLFVPGQTIFAKDYHYGKEKWAPGYIVRYTGNVICGIQSTMWAKHTNQLHPSRLPETKSNDTVILMDIS